jgi:hypothetical protein
LVVVHAYVIRYLPDSITPAVAARFFASARIGLLVACQCEYDEQSVVAYM